MGSSVLGEETFSLSKREGVQSSVSKYCLSQAYHKEGFVLELTLPPAMQMCCMVLWQQRLKLEMNCKCAPDRPYLIQTSKAYNKALAAFL